MKDFFTKQSAVIFILITMFLNFLGFSILFPILPFMVSKYVHNTSLIAFDVGLLLSIYALCSFFSSPGLGALSDRYGRKPILMISLLGSVIGYLVLGFAGSLWMLYLGRIIDGLTAGNISTIYAYMADVTKPQDRGKYFGLLGAAGGVGMIFGPAIGGLIGSTNLVLPLFISAGVTLLDMVFGYYILKESLQKEHRTISFSLSHLNPFAQFSHIFSIKVLRNIFLMAFVFFLAMNGLYGNNSVFLKDVFRWNPGEIGLLLFTIGFVDIFSQGFLIHHLLPKLGEIKVGSIGLVLTAVGFFLSALTTFFPIVALLYVGVIILNIGDGLVEPSVSSLMSRAVGPQMQGRVQGANQGMQSIARIVGPLLAAWLYGYWHGLPLTSQGFLVLIALIVLVISIPAITTHRVDHS